MTSRRRPLGITFISLGFVVNGLLILLVAFYSVYSGSSTAVGEALLWPKSFAIALDILNILLGTLAVVLGIGLWQMRSWSWVGTLVVQVMAMLGAIALGIINWLHLGFLWSDVFQLIGVIFFAALVAGYLLSPNVRSAF